MKINDSIQDSNVKKEIQMIKLKKIQIVMHYLKLKEMMKIAFNLEIKFID